MVTNAPSNLLWLADEWEKAISSAVLSGIVGDSAHQANPSKHNSYEDNPSGSWPREHSKDQKGPKNMSCAIDISMSQAHMELVHNRFKAVYNNRANDARAKYLYAFNGWDGNGSPGRYNLVKGTISETDDSHKWHEHVELFYVYVGNDDESWNAVRAILSIVKGQSEAQWSEEEDMPSLEEIAAAVWNHAEKNPAYKGTPDENKLVKKGSYVNYNDVWHYRDQDVTKAESAKVLEQIAALSTKLEELAASSSTVLTNQQVETIATKISEVLISDTRNKLNDSDKAVIVESVKVALREGIGSSANQ